MKEKPCKIEKGQINRERINDITNSNELEGRLFLGFHLGKMYHSTKRILQ